MVTAASPGGFFGRERELAELDGLMARAVSRSGTAVIISGEAGIGKTRLVDEFLGRARASGARVLRGHADPDSGRPFLVISSALGMEEPLLQEDEHATFTALFAVNKAGLLVAQSTSEAGSGMDADIFAGMLSAVQNFVRDSFDSSGAHHGSLGRLEYGNLKIIIKHGEDLFLAAVLSGEEHPDMDPTLQRTVDAIEAEHGEALRRWSGRVQDATSIQADVDALAARRFPVRRSLAGIKLENERLRIAHLVFEKLAAMSGEVPILVLLEDLHWADESSLAVLGYLARNVGRERILLLGTCRPGESQALGSRVDKMRAEATVRELTLERLDSRFIRDIVDSMFPDNDIPAEFAERLAGQCAGNPFFATEILKQMAFEGSIGSAGGRHVLLNPECTIPGTVEEAVQRRLESLESDTMAMVEYLACIGMRFDGAAALSIPSLRDPAKALRELASSGIIVPGEAGSSFCHGIFRDVTYQGIGDRWKLAYHKSIGEHYERTWDGSGELLYELARHFVRSPDKQKAYSYCLKAADMAESAFALEQAAAFLESALPLVPAQKLGGDSRMAEAAIIERLADMDEHMGRYASAISRLRGLSESKLPAEAEERARAFRKLSRALQLTGDYGAALEAAERAKGFLAGGRTAELANVLMCEGAVYEEKRDLDRSIGIQLEALAILKELGDRDADIGKVYARLGTCYWAKNELDKALEYFMNALEMTERRGDLRGQASGLNNIGIVYIRKGDYNNAAEYLTRSKAMASKIGDQFSIASSSGNLGNVYMAKGEYDKARAEYDVCLGIFTRMGAKMALGMTLMNIGSIHEHLGEFGQAMESYLKSLEIRQSIGDKRGIAVVTLNMGNLYFDMGDYRRSLEHMEKALGLTEESVDRNGIIHSLCGIVRASIRLGSWADKAPLAERALSMSRELGMAENEMTALVLAGSLASLSKDWAAAEAAFARCIEYGAGGGYKRIHADALWGRGRMNAMKGERALGLEEMRAAREIYASMSQPHILREIDADIAKLAA